MNLLSEKLKFVTGLAPVADAFSGTVTSDVVSLAKYKKALAKIIKGVGTLGTSTVTVQASAADDGASPTAIAFKYRRIASGDTAGSVVDATTAGFTTTAGSGDSYLIEIDADDLPDGKPWFHIKMVEVVNDPVLGGIEIILGEPRYAGLTLPTAIV